MRSFARRFFASYFVIYLLPFPAGYLLAFPTASPITFPVGFLLTFHAVSDPMYTHVTQSWMYPLGPSWMQPDSMDATKA